MHEHMYKYLPMTFTKPALGLFAFYDLFSSKTARLHIIHLYGFSYRKIECVSSCASGLVALDLVSS